MALLLMQKTPLNGPFASSDQDHRIAPSTTNDALHCLKTGHADTRQEL